MLIPDPIRSRSRLLKNLGWNNSSDMSDGLKTKHEIHRDMHMYA